MMSSNLIFRLLTVTQTLLGLVSSLEITAPLYPANYEVKGNETFDYIVIGGGTAGSIIANRLTENENCSVLLIEAGGNPPLTSQIPGLFGTLPQTEYDYDFSTLNDHYANQHLIKKSTQVTAGKMLGGSSSLSHFIHSRGNAFDYSRWAAAAGDTSWNYDSMLPYFIKSENLIDKDILDSPTAKFHGTSGPVKITREPNPDNDNIIKSFAEFGLTYNMDINSNETEGITEPFFYIAKGLRSSMANSYLTPIKNRKNLRVWKQATVAKILFDENKNAIGVEAINSKNENIRVNATKEVILAAGTIKSPQLLMLSGVGPKSLLEEFNITVLSDLPVGENLQDHVASLLLLKLQKSIFSALDVNAAINIFKFPAPVTVGNRVLNSSDPYPVYQSINLYLPSNAYSRITQVCHSVFKYDAHICNQLKENINGRYGLLSVLSKNRPSSTGSVRLASADPLVDPLINVGHYSDPKDLDDMSSYLLDYTQVVNSSYFKSVDASYLDLDVSECKNLTRNTREYWKCYALATSTSLFQFCGTCALGTVLDTNLLVKGVQRLRVVDSSAFPSIISSDIMSAVIALAEKAADLIKNN